MQVKTIKKLVDKKGWENQMVQAMEECGELTQAINKVRRARLGEFETLYCESRLGLIEDMADMMIMIEQLQYICGITDEELFAMKQTKEKRTITKVGIMV